MQKCADVTHLRLRELRDDGSCASLGHLAIGASQSLQTCETVIAWLPRALPPKPCEFHLPWYPERWHLRLKRSVLGKSVQKCEDATHLSFLEIGFNEIFTLVGLLASGESQSLRKYEAVIK